MELQNMNNPTMAAGEESARSSTDACQNADSQEIRPLQRSPSHPYHAIAARISTSYLNVLLLMVPIGIMAGIFHWSWVVVFSLNLLAIVVLTSWITFSIAELSTSVGRFLDEAIKATLGNAIEMLVSPSCLSHWVLSRS
jgi:hypothetical protein